MTALSVPLFGERVALRRWLAIAAGLSGVLVILHPWSQGFVSIAAALAASAASVCYSLSALTTYGHANLYLKAQWQLMGALEALDGMLLFGLTTAFLFAMIQRVWPLGTREPRR